jgi:Short C-terminal domain
VDVDAAGIVFLLDFPNGATRREVAMPNVAQYHGGLSWAPDPAGGELTLNDQVIELTNGPPRRPRVAVRIQVKAIECVEVTSEQVAKSKIGATLVFGVWGGLAGKGGEDRGTLLVHLKSGQTGYFTIGGWSQHEILGKITPWLHATGIRVGTPAVEAGAPATQAFAPVSVADEIAKLGKLKTEGLLTDEEFAAEKARLLRR